MLHVFGYGWVASRTFVVLADVRRRSVSRRFGSSRSFYPAGRMRFGMSCTFRLVFIFHERVVLFCRIHSGDFLRFHPCQVAHSTNLQTPHNNTGRLEPRVVTIVLRGMVHQSLLVEWNNHGWTRPQCFPHRQGGSHSPFYARGYGPPFGRGTRCSSLND